MSRSTKLFVILIPAIAGKVPIGPIAGLGETNPAPGSVG